VDGLDGLVNSAGIFAGGPLVEIPADDVRRILEVNVLGVVRVTRAFFSLLRQRRGRIINISSESGRFVAPFVGPYCMSKYALEAYSDALRRELMPLGMPVVIVQPGAMRTVLLDGPPAIFERCADGSCFEASLRKGQRWAAQERDSAADPVHVARVVSHALRTRNPRLRYRVCNHPGRALLELLPARWVDTLLRWAM
jgi:NAD(P)-dependent dehydrogenase (short-subunit alcohol dehydrogenase family)